MAIDDFLGGAFGEKVKVGDENPFGVKVRASCGGHGGNPIQMEIESVGPWIVNLLKLCRIFWQSQSALFRLSSERPFFVEIVAFQGFAQDKLLQF